MSVYVIAEAGVNHNGSFELAKELIHASAKAGADAVKFQTFKASKLVTKEASKAEYQKENDRSSASQLEMLSKLELSDDQFVALSRECEAAGIDFLTTCFDEESLKYICGKTQLKFLKIGSGDLTNLPLIIEHARTGKNIIISTGMATMSEVEDAMAALAFGYLADKTIQPKSYNQLKLEYFTSQNISLINDKVTILHCVTDYPAKFEDLNLDAIRQLQSVYKVGVGYSDHSLGIEACCAAVALGSTCIEKHITLDKNMDGPDHAASASPDEFKRLVDAIRNLEKALVPSVKAPTVRERKNLTVARKFLVAKAYIEQGDKFTVENVEIKRSKIGMSPKSFWDILGKQARKPFDVGENICL